MLIRDSVCVCVCSSVCVRARRSKYNYVHACLSTVEAKSSWQRHASLPQERDIQVDFKERGKKRDREGGKGSAGVCVVHGERGEWNGVEFPPLSIEEEKEEEEEGPLWYTWSSPSSTAGACGGAFLLP